MRRRVLSYAFLSLAATAAVGGYAINRLLDRPGETVLAMVPANALGAVSIDLVPAPDQIVAFKSIDDMLASATKDPKGASPNGALIGSLLHEIVGEPALAPLDGQIDRSIAFAALPKRDPKADGEEGVALMPVKNPSAVAAFLRTGSPETVEGVAMAAFKRKNGESYRFCLQGSTLIGASQGWVVADVAKVARGEAKSLVADPAFVAARAQALPSANVLVFASPKTVHGDAWTVGSLTIRDTGIEVGFSGKTNDPDVLKAGSFAPIGANVLASLPRGAYGFVATAQPGPAFALAGGSLDEPAKDMKKEMDLDLRGEVLPALGGNLVLGFYPSFGADAGLDLLVSIDDANGADPASLARKLEGSLGKQIEENDKDAKGPWKVDVAIPGAQASRLADEPNQAIGSGVREMEKSYFRPLTLSRGKTVAWATVGHSVILATSVDLLDRAVALRKAPSMDLGLSGDSALGAHSQQAADGQFALAISMKRLAEGIRNTVDPSHMTPDVAKEYRKALSLYDNVTEPLAIRANMTPDGGYHGYVSIPFDWSKLPGMVK